MLPLSRACTRQTHQHMSFPFFTKARSQKQQLDLIRDELRLVQKQIAAQVTGFEPHVQDYMAQICKAQGKLIRPGLVLLTAGATGGIKPEHITFAAMLELVHMATLVHDDVLDHADTRRDKPTPNALWGNELAVLLGDVMLSHAMVMGTDLGDTDFCRMIAQIVRDVCQGEVEQSSRLFDLDMTRADYYELIRKKTASLFAAAMKGAAWISGMPEDIVDELNRMGTLLGIAYQIYDDCLDMVGNEHSAGKTLHTDAEKGKLTLPVYFLLESSSDDIAAEVHDAIARREGIDYERIARTNAFQEAISRSVDEGLAQTAAAREPLWHLPQTPYRDALVEMTYRLDELLENCRN